MNSYTNNSTPHGNFGTLVGRSEYVTAYHPRQFKRLLRRATDAFAHWLTTGSMPRISKAMQGDTEVWKVYDPVSNQTLYFDQENSLRVWMEERYYQ